MMVNQHATPWRSSFWRAGSTAATLNLDEIISNDRTDALELRIWVTGEDMAGNAFSED